MNERMKEVRRAVGLTQREFGLKIGVKQNTVATYEMGRNKPTDTVIALICRTFNVNEQWLRTGEGEMFTELSAEEEMITFCTDVLKVGKSDPRFRIVKALAKLSDDDWELVDKMIDTLLAK